MTCESRIVTLACATLAPRRHCRAGRRRRRPVDVTDTYHGVTVHDPYRWLEDGSAPAVKAWTQAQNARTRAHLDAVPSRAAIKARLDALVTRGTPSFWSLQGARRAHLRDAQRSEPSSSRCWLRSTRPPIRPAARSCSIRTRSMPAAPRPSTGTGHRRTASSSPSRCPSAAARSARCTSTRPRPARRSASRSRRCRRRPPAAAWPGPPTAAAFWYTRYPGEERPEADRQFYQQVYFHKLGTDWHDDPLVLGSKDGLPRVAEIFLGRDNRRDLDRCAGAERRRRRVCALCAEPGRRGPARRLRGQDRRSRLEPERRDLRGVARRRAERQGLEAAAAVCAVRRCAKPRSSCRRATSRSRWAQAWR